jgi:hypothetical protein
MVLGQAVITAEKADAPPDFTVVELITTVRTYTIVNIYGSAEFDEEAMARKFAAKYSDLLGTLYAGKCKKLKAYLEEELKMLCSQSYELTVQHFKPDGPDKKHKVQVGLKMNNESALGKRLTAQFHGELREIEAEAKRGRLNKAAEEGALKGLK